MRDDLAKDPEYQYELSALVMKYLASLEAFYRTMSRNLVALPPEEYKAAAQHARTAVEGVAYDLCYLPMEGGKGVFERYGK